MFYMWSKSVLNIWQQKISSTSEPHMCNSFQRQSCSQKELGMKNPRTIPAKLIYVTNAAQISPVSATSLPIQNSVMLN